MSEAASILGACAGFWTDFAKKIKPLTWCECCIDVRDGQIMLYIGTMGDKSFTTVWGIPGYKPSGAPNRPNPDEIARVVNRRKMRPEDKDRLIASDQSLAKSEEKSRFEKDMNDQRHEALHVVDRSIKKTVISGYKPASPKGESK